MSANDVINYMTALNLNRDPFAPEPDLTFLYEYESVEKIYALLKNLVSGTEIIILVLGEAGAGKTTLLKRYLTTSAAGWKTCRLRIHPRAKTEAEQSELFKDADRYPAYALQEFNDSTYIIDDAHELNPQQLAFLLQNAQSSTSSDKINRFVLFGEPSLNETVNSIAGTLNNETAISKIFMPSLTREQTKSYIDYRLAVAGYIGKSLFRSSDVKKIHHSSGGLPGRINAMADQQLKENFSKRKPHSMRSAGFVGQYRTLMGWAAAGLAVAVICIFGLYHFRGASKTGSENSRLVKTVFRAKIEMADQLPKTPALIAETSLKEEDIPESTPLGKDTRHPPNGAPAAGQPVVIAKISEPPPLAPQPSPETRTAAEKEKTDQPMVYREDWLLSQESSSYTIQILGVRNIKNLHNFIETQLPAKANKIAYYKTSYQGKDWYPLLYGVYATKKDASSAMKQLPPKIQKASPWIRKMSFIQSAIRKQQPLESE